MSRIDDMIAKHCPNGVPRRKLDDVLDYSRPDKYIVKSTKYDDSHALPVLTAGDSFILGYTDEINGIYRASKEKPVIIFDDFTTSFHWVDFDFKVKSSAMKMLTPKENIDFRYVYYAMKCVRYVPSSHARQWISTYSNFEIPIPPLEVQQEIVDILNKFTKLEAELEAELEARRKQYGYYRDKLLSFNDNMRGGVSWKTMGEIGTFVRGNGLQKKDFTDSGVGCIHYGQIYTYYGTFADKTKSFVSESFAKKMRKAHTGDLVIATTSENDEDVCKAVAWLGKDDIAISGDAYIYRHSLHPKYAAYFFQTEQFEKQKKRHISGTKVKRVSGDSMGKFLIPVPSMEEQERIVSILDKFNMLANDLSEGLPAEITARHQQYEHYRNRLLTFQEAA
jgi:type I restriction enzyme, S subunit